MTLDDYAAWAAGLRGGRPAAEGDAADDRLYLAYLGLGLAGESGEVVEHVKKLLRDGRWDPAAVAEELGDLIYYWACLCAATGTAPSALLQASARKIAARSGAALPG
ncbi:MAG: MazG nucleotide pyrophosphohydrolase domain-containing protein [Dongiaceae bacterium]